MFPLLKRLQRQNGPTQRALGPGMFGPQSQTSVLGSILLLKLQKHAKTQAQGPLPKVLATWLISIMTSGPIREFIEPLTSKQPLKNSSLNYTFW